MVSLYSNAAKHSGFIAGSSRRQQSPVVPSPSPLGPHATVGLSDLPGFREPELARPEMQSIFILHSTSHWACSPPARLVRLP